MFLADIIKLPTSNIQLTSVELLFIESEAIGLDPQWVADKVLFSVTLNNVTHYIGNSKSNANSQKSSSMVQNKYFSRLILQDKGLPNIPFLQTSHLDEASSFLNKHQTIIAKPLLGWGSKDIHIISDSKDLANLDLDKYLFEKYILGREMRYLILNGKVIAVHQSDYGLSVDADRYLERISYPIELWNEELVDKALEISEIFNLQFSAVDFLIDEDENWHILEVNTTPGLKWFHSPTSGPIVNVAKKLMNALIEDEGLAAPIIANSI